MTFFRPALICLALLLPAFAQEPRKDTFLASDDEIRAVIPRDFGVKQVSVQLDWIRLPHLTANQLIRQHLKRSTDGAALYKAALDLVAAKQAERIDLTTTVVRGGQRSRNESIAEHPFPTELSSPQVSEDAVIPSSMSSFATRSTGRSCVVEATVGEDGTSIDLNFAPAWVEHLADIPWGTGPSEMKQPVFGTNKTTEQLLLKNGEWQMAGLFTPPHGTAEGKLYGSVAALPAERVILFVRASLPPPRKAVAPVEASHVRQVMVLAEWIEADTAIVADLLAKNPAFADTSAIREALEPMLRDGRASLLESSALQIRGGQRSKIESITEFPYPTENQSAQGPQPSPGAAKPAAPAMVAPAAPSAFATRNLGTTMEIEATVGDGNLIDLNLAPELIFYPGTISYGQGVSEIWQPKFQSLKTTLQLITIPGAPSMVGSFDAPVREGTKPATVQARKVLLFVRAIL